MDEKCIKVDFYTSFLLPLDPFGNLRELFCFGFKLEYMEMCVLGWVSLPSHQFLLAHNGSYSNLAGQMFQTKDWGDVLKTKTF